MMLVISLNFPAIFWSHIQPHLPLVVTRPMCDRIATSNNIAQRGHGYLHPTYAGSLCRFTYSLWFTHPIIALVTSDQAADSRQDSLISALYRNSVSIPIWDCLVHDWIWSSTRVQWRRQMFETGERCRKNRTYQRPFTCTVRTSLTGILRVRSSPQKFFLIGRDAISRWFEGLTSTL